MWFQTAPTLRAISYTKLFLTCIIQGGVCIRILAFNLRVEEFVEAKTDLILKMVHPHSLHPTFSLPLWYTFSSPSSSPPD
jgi:hypothetical protein